MDSGLVRRACQLAALLSMSLSAAPAGAWGRVAHQGVTTRAISALPKGLKGFMERHALELPSLAPDARLPEEGLARRFAVDRLGRFPFQDVPQTESEFGARYGDAAGEVGRLPWLIQESYGRLILRFKAREKTAILEEADLLAGLLTDLHNPLALTENFDGQKTHQDGLWQRFSVRLPEAATGLRIDADAAHLIDDPPGHVFGMIRATYVWADNIVYEEELARSGGVAGSLQYFSAFMDRCGEILRQRLGWAARDVSSYWYTAWVAAGKPPLE
jgi:hypothetical protein